MRLDLIHKRKNIAATAAYLSGSLRKLCGRSADVRGLRYELLKPQEHNLLVDIYLLAALHVDCCEAKMMFHLSLECFCIDIEEIPLQHTYEAEHSRFLMCRCFEMISSTPSARSSIAKCTTTC